MLPGAKGRCDGGCGRWVEDQGRAIDGGAGGEGGRLVVVEGAVQLDQSNFLQII